MAAIIIVEVSDVTPQAIAELRMQTISTQETVILFVEGDEEIHQDIKERACQLNQDNTVLVQSLYKEVFECFIDEINNTTSNFPFIDSRERQGFCWSRFLLCRRSLHPT